MNKKFAQVAFGSFVVVSGTIIALHAFALGRGLQANMTISQYVGLDHWSAIVFLAANALIAYVWVRYAVQVAKEWGMSKVWRALAVGAAVFLILLSLCPIGLYDAVPGEYGVVSQIHRFSSTSMFVLMIMTAIGLMVRIKKWWFRLYAGVYALYGIMMAVLFFGGNGWFWSNTLVTESAFILAYLLMLCIIPQRAKLEQGESETDEE